MRNGAVADSMRKAGAPYRIIFGLNLPQIKEIAADFGPDRELALELRRNEATRESLLIAPMLYPPEELTLDEACQWLLEATTTEVIDVACLRLIKHLPQASELLTELSENDNPLARYAALRLGANLLPKEMDLLETIARAEAARCEPLTLSTARIILDDIDFRRSDQ